MGQLLFRLILTLLAGAVVWQVSKGRKDDVPAIVEEGSS